MVRVSGRTQGLTATAVSDLLEPRRMLTNVMPVVVDQAFTIQDDAAFLDSVGTVVATDADNVPGLQFQFGNPNTGFPIVLGLTSFDNGLMDGFANQLFEPVGGSDRSFELTSDGSPVAFGEFVNIEIITDTMGNSTGTFTMLINEPGSDDTTIFDEIFAASGDTGIMTATLGTFDFEGVDFGLGDDASLFSSTGTGTFTNGGMIATADFQFDVIASNLDESQTAFGIPGEHPFQDINVGRGAVTAVTNLPSTSTVVQDVSDPLRFEIVGGSGANIFFIDQYTGEIQVVGDQFLDAMNTPSYTLDVLVTDSGVPALTDMATITINVTAAPMASPENLVTASVVDGNFFNITSDGASFTTIPAGALPVSQPLEKVMYGDFNGDGDMDFVARNANLKSWHVGINNGDSHTFTRWLTGWNTIDDVFVGDFNGDGLDDLAGRREASARWRLALSDGTDFIDQGSSRDARGGATTFSAVAIADFDGDGSDDRGVYDENTRHWFVQITGSDNWSAWGSFWPSGQPVEQWQVGDFNGDGLADIAGILPFGRVQAGYSTGSDFAGQGPGMGLRAVLPPTNYNWFSVGDFDGDGSDELVGRTPNDAFVVTEVPQGSTAFGTAWRVQPISQPVVGDFNGDGLDDIAGVVGAGSQFEMLRSTGMRFDNPVWPGAIGISEGDIDELAAGDSPSPSVRSIASMPPAAALNSLFDDEDELDGFLATL